MNIEEEGNPAPFPADLQVFPFFQTGPADKRWKERGERRKS